MDLLHTQFIQSRNLIDKVSTIKNINYTGLIADEDPTRLNRNIGSNSESIITTTLFVYNNSKEAHSYSDGASGKIKAANITAGECGQLTYKDILYLVLYYNSPVRVIPGNSFISTVPTITYYSNKSGTPILIPLKLPHYLLCDSLTEVKGKALLCPGTFKFTSLKVNGIIQNIAIYSPISAKDYLSLNQNEDINLASLKYDSTNIIPFLTHFHTRRVQRGYYANVNSSTHKVFLKHGLNFNTDLVSYYEEIKDSNKVDKTSLPFYEYPNTIYIKLYTAECNLKEGKLEQPIFFNTVPSKENNYTTLTHVDLRVIDLNFMWNERQRKSTEPFPQSGYYSLTPEDTTFLEYYTHSPNIVVATFGYMKGDKILFEEVKD